MQLNQVYQESCLTGMKKIPNECIDLIFTDPPYYQYKAKNLNFKNAKTIVKEFEFDDFKNETEYLKFIEDVLKECYRVSKVGASGYVWCNTTFVSDICRIVERQGFKLRKTIHWHKTNPFPAIHTRKMFANSMEIMLHFSKGVPKTWNHKSTNEMHNFIENSICGGKERKKHATQKPLKVCIPYVEISSNKGDTILDPFMGSGTTAMACLKTNRNYIGYETNPVYCDIIKERVAEFEKEKMQKPLKIDLFGSRKNEKHLYNGV